MRAYEIITESHPYLLAYYRKFVLTIVFELSSKYLQKKLSILKHIYKSDQYLIKVTIDDF